MFQNESQNAYFDQQVTVHPFMYYYINNSAQKQSEEEIEEEWQEDVEKLVNIQWL